METINSNTVILDLKSYNDLRDFNEAIKNGGAVTIFYSYDSVGQHIYTANAVINILTEYNNTLKKEIDELKNPDKKQPTIEEIKKMNWWQFRKWKRSNRF